LTVDCLDIGARFMNHLLKDDLDAPLGMAVVWSVLDLKLPIPEEKASSVRRNLEYDEYRYPLRPDLRIDKPTLSALLAATFFTERVCYHGSRLGHYRTEKASPAHRNKFQLARRE